MKNKQQVGTAALKLKPSNTFRDKGKKKEKKTNPKNISRVKQKSQIRHKRPNEQKNRKTTREENSHAATGWNLAPISEPGDLWLREAANAWCWNHSTLSLRD